MSPTQTVTGDKVAELFGAVPTGPEITLPPLAEGLDLEGRPDSAYWRSIARTKQRFNEYKGAGFKMTVLHDVSGPGGSPYRHLRFRGDDALYHFDILTWPGHLAVGGGIEAFTFRRLHDMMDFFGGVEINPSYWSEKVVAGNARSDFDFEVYLDTVVTQIEEIEEDYDVTDAAAIRRAVKAELMDEEPLHAIEAHERLRDFEVRLPNGGTYDFGGDTWELDVDGYNFHFLMACHAIKYAVDAYRAEYRHRIIKEVA